MSDLGPLDHIARPPVFPWWEPDRTECGRPLTDLEDARVITRAEVHKRIKDLGRTRTAFTTCLTCVETANRWPDDPIASLHRELGQIFNFHQWGTHRYGPDYWKTRGEAARKKHEWQLAQYNRFMAELDTITTLMRQRSGSHEPDPDPGGRAPAVSLADYRSRKTSA